MRRRTLISLLGAGTLTACTDSATGGAGGRGSDDGGSDGGTGGGSGTGSDGGAPNSPSPTVDPLRELARSLDLRAAAAQLVWVGIPVGSHPVHVEDVPLGGYFPLGVWRSAEDVEAAVAATRPESDGGSDDGGSARPLTPILAVDQEGGQVRMLRGGAARVTPSAETLGAQGTDAVTSAYTSIGEDLTARGIPLALAPVADVVDPDLGSDNAPVGKVDRGFGTDPEQVGRCVRAAVTALDDAGVGATLKHFPGLGRVRENTDFSAEGIEDDRTTADDPFLGPFRDGIEAGADAVMLSSAIYPQIDPDHPAMFSHAVVTGVLREKMGFDGLVVSDDIGSAKAVQSVPVARRATRVVDAGGDVVLTADPQLAGQLVTALTDWADGDEERTERLLDSVVRVLAVKQRRGLLD